jgi:Protein of unknown function (DUF2393).
MGSQASQVRKDNEAEGTRIFEWIAAAISACLFVALVAYLLILGLGSQPEEVAFELMQDAPRERGGAYHLDFTLANRGRESAAEVHVAITPAGDGETEAEVVFDYVPAGSKRRGTFVLSRDPGDRTLLRVTAFREP